MSSVFSTGSIVAPAAATTLGPINVPASAATLDSSTIIIVRLLHVGTTSQDLTPASFTNGFALVPGSGKYSTQGTTRTWIGHAYKRGDGATTGTTVTWNVAATSHQGFAEAYKTAKVATPFLTPVAVATDSVSLNAMTVPSMTTDEDDCIVTIFAGTDINWGGTGIAAGNSFTLGISGGSANKAALFRRTVATSGTSIGTTGLSWTSPSRAAAEGLVLKTGLVNTPPTLSVTAPQDLAAGDTFHIIATAADVDAGDSTTVNTTVVPAKSSVSQSLTGAATTDVSGTVGAPGSVVTTATVATDTHGAPSPTVYTEIRSLKSGTIDPLPFDGHTDGSTWARVGGAAATDGELLAGTANSAVYIQAPNASASVTYDEFRLEASVPIDGGTVKMWLSKSSANLLTITPKLYEGTTLRKTWPAVAGVAGTTMVEVDVVIDAGTADAYGSFGDWTLRLEQSI